MVQVADTKWIWNGTTLLISQDRPFFDATLGHMNASMWSVYLDRDEAQLLLDNLKEWLDAG